MTTHNGDRMTNIHASTSNPTSLRRRQTRGPTSTPPKLSPD